MVGDASVPTANPGGGSTPKSQQRKERKTQPRNLPGSLLLCPSVSIRGSYARPSGQRRAEVGVLRGSVLTGLLTEPRVVTGDCPRPVSAIQQHVVSRKLLASVLTRPELPGLDTGSSLLGVSFGLLGAGNLQGSLSTLENQIPRHQNIPDFRLLLKSQGVCSYRPPSHGQ